MVDLVRAGSAVLLLAAAGLGAGACAAPADDGASADAVAFVTSSTAPSCGPSARAVAWARGAPLGEVVVYRIQGQPMEARMARAFRRLAAVHPGLAISDQGLTVFRSMEDQAAVAQAMPALAAAPGYSNHQSGHAVDLDVRTLPDAATLACFGFARPYALEGSRLVETPFGGFARRRYADEGAVPPGRTLDQIRRQVAGEAWHYELDEELATERARDDATCAALTARADADLGDGACDAAAIPPSTSASTGAPASPGGCASKSLAREVMPRTCVRLADGTWNRCDSAESGWQLDIDAAACGAVPCGTLPERDRRCPLSAAGRATPERSDLCALDGAVFPSTDSVGEGGGRDWTCQAHGCGDDGHCWR